MERWREEKKATKSNQIFLSHHDNINEYIRHFYVLSVAVSPSLPVVKANARPLLFRKPSIPPATAPFANSPHNRKTTDIVFYFIYLYCSPMCYCLMIFFSFFLSFLVFASLYSLSTFVFRRIIFYRLVATRWAEGKPQIAHKRNEKKKKLFFAFCTKTSNSDIKFGEARVAQTQKNLLPNGVSNPSPADIHWARSILRSWLLFSSMCLLFFLLLLLRSFVCWARNKASI